jgi:hypothetical protein
MDLSKEVRKLESYFGNSASDAEAEAISRGLQVTKKIPIIMFSTYPAYERVSNSFMDKIGDLDCNLFLCDFLQFFCGHLPPV